MKKQSMALTLVTLVALASLGEFAFAQRDDSQSNYQLKAIPFKPGVGRGKLRISDEMKLRLEATVVRNGLAVSFSNLTCGDLNTESCLEKSRSPDGSFTTVRASLDLDSWSESNTEIDRALSEFTTDNDDRITLKRSAILIRLVVGKMQEQINLNPANIVPESLLELSSKSGIQALELHHHVILLRDRVILSSIAVNRTADDYKLHRAILQLPPSEIPLDKSNPDLGKAAQWAIEQAVSEFGRRLPSAVERR